jgi:hypothetical protein
MKKKWKLRLIRFVQIDRCPHQYTACVLRVSIVELVIKKLHPHFLVCGNIIVQNAVLFLSIAFMTAQVSAETKFKPCRDDEKGE